VLLAGLRQNGATVIECNERSSGPFKYIRLALNILATAPFLRRDGCGISGPRDDASGADADAKTHTL